MISACGFSWLLRNQVIELVYFQAMAQCSVLHEITSNDVIESVLNVDPEVCLIGIQFTESHF